MGWQELHKVQQEVPSSVPREEQPLHAGEHVAREQPDREVPGGHGEQQIEGEPATRPCWRITV